jgi:hypothetical protein
VLTFYSVPTHNRAQTLDVNKVNCDLTHRASYLGNIISDLVQLRSTAFLINEMSEECVSGMDSTNVFRKEPEFPVKKDGKIKSSTFFSLKMGGGGSSTQAWMPTYVSILHIPQLI